jgi:hypothetical protein
MGLEILILDIKGNYMKLFEMLRKPTLEDLKTHNKFENRGKLYYTATSEDGKKVLGYVDDAYVRKLRDKMNKKISPKDAGKIRLKQVEYFKEKNNE